MVPFSPPFAIDKKAKKYGCYIDVNGLPYAASWTGNWAVSDFTDTSGLSNFQLSPFQLSAELLTAWKASSPLSFGSHASVRLDETKPYPVAKIAHPTAKSRDLVAREFSMMRYLSKLNAIARTAEEPLIDQDGIFGFRLERLSRVGLDELVDRIAEVESLLDTLHNAGYCHGDCSLSNIMQNEDGKLVLIDLAFAGPIGGNIPNDFPKHLFPADTFTAEIDLERVKKWGNHRT